MRLERKQLIKLVEGLRSRRAWAERDLLIEFRPVVEGTLVRVLGSHRELPDLIQDVFLRTLERIDELREPAALPGYLRTISVFVARETIRRRRRRRWLSFFAPADLPDAVTRAVDPEVRAAMRAFHAIVERMGPREQRVFTLRYVDGLDLAEIAGQCALSLSTVKRRLARAESVFVPAARASEELAPWLQAGVRWGAIVRSSGPVRLVRSRCAALRSCPRKSS